jgi:hypothetical protein
LSKAGPTEMGRPFVLWLRVTLGKKSAILFAVNRKRFKDYSPSVSDAALAAGRDGQALPRDVRTVAPADLAVLKMQGVAGRYSARFGNLDVVAHPSILTDLRFVNLLATALETGHALSRQAVELVFPGVAWEY